MSLIDEALRRAQSARRPADPATPSPQDPWEAAPLPDARRSRRRIRAAAASITAVLLIAGAAAFVRARRSGRPEASRLVSANVGREQPPASGPKPSQPITTPPSEESRMPGHVPTRVAEPPGGVPIATTRHPSEVVPSARRSEAPAAPVAQRGPEPAPVSRPASSSPGIAAPVRPAPVPLGRQHTSSPGGVSERTHAVHVGQVNVPGGHIELGGIVYSESNPVAVLNGRVVAIGGIVEGFTVVSIQESRVELTDGHRTIFLAVR